MPGAREIVILGGGHNGLVAAFYLARAGLRPLVLERREVVGGAATTAEFHPGFRASLLAHGWGPLRPEIFRHMALEKFGLEIIRPEPRVFAPSPDGSSLLLYSDPARTAAEIGKFSRNDAERYLEFARLLGYFARILSRVMALTPPDIDHPSSEDLWNLIKVGREFRGLGKKQMFRLLRWAPMPVADLLGEFFQTELLRATLAARGIFGTAMGPRSIGSSAALLMRAAADAHPAGPASFPRGGLGALAEALAAAAREAGAEIRTSVEVAQIQVKKGAVSGVVLASGEEIPAKVVVSNADPQRTLLRLVDPIHLDPDFVFKLQSYRCSGSLAKMNLALSGLPAFTALRGQPEEDARRALAGRIHIGATLDELERAFDDSKYGRASRRPWLEVQIPSLSDPSLAPPGQHVMSICAHYFPYHLRDANLPQQREAFANAVVAILAECAPNLPGKILHRQMITPRELEETYSLTGGHIFHGELALDQLFTMRPLLGWARYRTPLAGLYLCGSGTHPGTGLTGASGANAAREILRDLRRR